jgi:Protein of unknown function (DUF455)
MYESLYQAVLDGVETLGYMTYGLQTALRVCRSLQVKGTPKLRSPLTGSPKTVVQTLLHLGVTREKRLLQSPIRIRRGNTNKRYDPRWQLLPLGSRLPRMKQIETQTGLMHKLHHTAFREPVATEMAALNLFEYDGMPWEFYLDMSRQAEDEARHALLAAARLTALGGRIGQFPVGYLGNFYQMFWEMTLAERVVPEITPR